jgi:hypothetical protein
MEDHTYKKIEITGTSKSSVDEAINNALKKAAESVKHMRWFEVVEVRGDIDGDKVNHFQVTVKIGFQVD